MEKVKPPILYGRFSELKKLYDKGLTHEQIGKEMKLDPKYVAGLILSFVNKDLFQQRSGRYVSGSYKLLNQVQRNKIDKGMVEGKSFKKIAKESHTSVFIVESYLESKNE